MWQRHRTEKNKAQTLFKGLSLIEWVLASLVAVLVIIISLNVFSRYVLNIGIDWSDEVSRLFFIWIVFLGAYMAFKRKSHATMNVLGRFIPDKFKKYHKLVTGLLEAGFMFVITWFGMIQVLDTAKFGQKTPGLGVPMYWFYIVMPFTALLIVIAILSETIGNFKNKRGDE